MGPYDGGFAQFERRARRWQCRPWALSTLHVDLGVTLVIEDSAGWRILGASARDGEGIGVALNHRIVGTPLELPIRAHEFGHVALGLESVALCTSMPTKRPLEDDAWCVGTLYAVPAKLAMHDVLPTDAARICQVPVQMVMVRRALVEFAAVHGYAKIQARQRLNGALSALRLWVFETTVSLMLDERRRNPVLFVGSSV